MVSNNPPIVSPISPFGHEGTSDPLYEARPSYYLDPEANPHIGHKHHLCCMVKEGVVTLEQFKALVKNPKFICRKCGRVANKEENLCEPLPL